MCHISRNLEMRCLLWMWVRGMRISKGDDTSPVRNDRVSRGRFARISEFRDMWHYSEKVVPFSRLHTHQTYRTKHLSKIFLTQERNGWLYVYRLMVIVFNICCTPNYMKQNFQERAISLLKYIYKFSWQTFGTPYTCTF
jgi:hypothetical protein